MTFNAIRKQLQDESHIKEHAFSLLKTLSMLVNEAEAEDRRTEKHREIQELVLLALDKAEHFGNHQVLLNGIVRKLGLFPYLEPEVLSIRDLIAFEAHRPDGLDDDIVFHRMQATVYRALMNDENVILSAPTSFGKSLIIDALIASSKYNNIVIIVPTIALIDETRRRLCSRFKQQFKIITHQSQTASNKNIFILTQERALDRQDYPPIDLFVLDEFYKLQPPSELWDDRTKALNLCFLNFIDKFKARQFYLLGPNIEEVKIPKDDIDFRFIYTNYSTVAVEHKTYITTQKNEYQKLVEVCSSLDGQTIIYCASPSQANRVAEALLAQKVNWNKATATEFSDAGVWIRDNYHQDWVFPRALEAGLGIHHARIPRALAHYVVKKFNDGNLQFLICTSTLIEGVNTKAENIVVFNNKSGTKKYDYFTFNNICGRSGRMGHHFVGKVFILKPPPEKQTTTVEVPIFSDEDKLPDSVLIHYDFDSVSTESRERIGKYHQEDYLSLETIKKNNGIEPQYQIELAKHIFDNRRAYYRQLFWKGHYPSYSVLDFVCKLIWTYFVRSPRRQGQVSSGSSLARMINILSFDGVPGLIKDQLKSGNSPDDAVENSLDFLRSWATFKFPSLLMALNNIQKEIYEKENWDPGDYRYLAVKVENLFYEPPLYTLEEYGLPVQLAKKLAAVIQPNGSLDDALSNLKRYENFAAQLSPFEKELFLDTVTSI